MKTRGALPYMVLPYPLPLALRENGRTHGIREAISHQRPGASRELRSVTLYEYSTLQFTRLAISWVETTHTYRVPNEAEMNRRLVTMVFTTVNARHTRTFIAHTSPNAEREQTKAFQQWSTHT